MWIIESLGVLKKGNGPFHWLFYRHNQPPHLSTTPQGITVDIWMIESPFINPVVKKKIGILLNRSDFKIEG